MSNTKSHWIGRLTAIVLGALSSLPAVAQTQEKGPDDPAGALEFRRLQLQDENGQIPPNALMRAVEQKRRMSIQPGAWSQFAPGDSPDDPNVGGIGPGVWSWNGPGNIGGRVRSLVIHPTTPATMWAGSVGGGVWKTTNSGTSWTALNDFMANLAVASMVIDPTNPNILYAGTGEGMGNIHSLSGAGVFKTTDGGATWTQLSATSSWDAVNRLAISPANSQTIIAATGEGIFRTTNGGTTWTETYPYRMLYASFHPTVGSLAVASSDGSALYSTDGGVSWTQAAGLPTSGRIELVYAPGNGAIVYASCNNNGGEIYKSTDGGQSYARVNTGQNYLGTQGWYDNAIWVSPSSSQTLIVGGIDLWRSTNGGVTLTKISRWDRAPNTSAHADQHAIVHHPGFNGTTNKTVFFGNDGGVYRATDALTATLESGWTELNNNLGITQFYGAAGNPSSGVIVGGTQDNGTLRYSSAGGAQGWTTMFGGDGGSCAADPTNSSYFYGEYVRLQIHRSTNGGTSSGYIYSGIGDAGSNALFIAPFILDPNNANRLLAGGASLWRSDNAKAATPTWTAIKSAIAGGHISAIAVAPGHSEVIWVGHSNGDVYFTNNGTAASPTWTKADGGSPALPNRYCMRITIDPANSSKVYVTFGGYSSGNVWRTTTNGASWTNLGGNLPSSPVRSLVVSPTDSNSIYVGSEVGVFASSDGGASWSPTNDGPANVSVDELFWLNNKLVAATHGRGLFTATLNSAPMASVTVVANPTNAGTTSGSGTYVVGTTTQISTTANSGWTFTGWNDGVTTNPRSVTVASGGSTYTANFTATVANDNFASAQVITGPSGTVNGSNPGASKQTGEPNHGGNAGGKSVWYKWTAPASGSIIFDTAGSNFDTLLGVYTGTSVNGLSQVATNDDANGTAQSSVTFNAVANTNYFVAVDGKNSASGAIVLNWRGQNLTATLTVQANPTSGGSVSGGGTFPIGSSQQISATTNPGWSFTGWNDGATTNPRTVVVPSNGATYTANFSQQNAPLTLVANPTNGGTVTGAGTFAVGSSRQISATPTSGWTFAGWNDGVATNPRTVTVPAGGATYTANFAPPPGANNNFAAAQTLTGAEGVVFGQNTTATKESGEPDHGGDIGGKSVWYRWTAPGNGVVNFDTLGSEFDTLLGVYTGTVVSALTLVASNDDANGDTLQSSVSFQCSAGVIYRIAVDGYGAASGPFTLNWRSVAPPVNDNFSAAQLLSGPSGTLGASNTAATKETGEPDHAGDFGGRSIWFKWVATASGLATFDTFGSDFDTLLAVYSGSSLPGLVSLGSNDDAAGGLQSSVTFSATAGATYWIAVDGYGGDAGSIDLNWTAAGAARPSLLNISTRMRVQTGDNVMIGGLIITGNQPKQVIIRAMGPSLSRFGLNAPLSDPVLELYDSSGTYIAGNDDWPDADNTRDMTNTGLIPTDTLESIIMTTLPPGAYTAIVSGFGGATGVGVVEAYDLDQTSNSRIGNIATRGFVQTNDNVMIGGFIVGDTGAGARVVLRAIGPSLLAFGIANALSDTTVQLHDSNGGVIGFNDNWKDSQQVDIQSSGLAPSDDREAAIAATLGPGAYTAVVRGKDNTTGVALIEVYGLQ
jgi:photosystem II stability/assembly factor-like uncharacterized protein